MLKNLKTIIEETKNGDENRVHHHHCGGVLTGRCGVMRIRKLEPSPEALENGFQLGYLALEHRKLLPRL